MNDDDKRLTAAEAAKYLGISTDEVYELCKTSEIIDGRRVEVTPEIAHYRVGRKRKRIVIPMSSLEDYDQRSFVPARSSTERSLRVV